VKAEEKD